MPDDFVVDGKIGSRWRAWGAAGGAFGRPLGPEEDIPGRNGRRQQFERGEIAWSPDQDMIVSVYRLRNEACFEWERTGFEYDYFRYDITYNGVGQGQAAMQLRGTTHIWTRLQGFGEYAFTVKGCHSPIIGPDECEQGLTIPVRVKLDRSAETPNPGGPNVSGVIEERWHELGAWSGPLGKPTTQEGFRDGVRSQRFEHGSITTAPSFGPRMVVAAYQRGKSIEVNWGGADTAYNAFRVDVYTPGGMIRQELVWLYLNTEWARPWVGSGQFVLHDVIGVGGTGTYFFFIFPIRTQSPFPSPLEFPQGAVATPEAPPAGSTPPVRVRFKHGDGGEELAALGRQDAVVRLDPPAMTGTPSRAFASHIPRARATARHYARTRPLYVAFDKFRPSDDRIEDDKGSSEDDALKLIAHLQAVSEDPDYRNPGELPSRTLIAVALRQMVSGKVGTKKDYDMALKGLMFIAYRYRKLLTEEDLDFILQGLVPNDLYGGHSLSTELYFPIPGSALFVSETENHLYMIESTRYLVNQLLFERTGDEKYDNVKNGLTKWLLGYMQTIAKHDFLEFNSRPYQRMSLHALFNLHEFALDDSIRTAAQILLDYTMIKFAVSSNRQRRIGPFRRLQERTNYPEGEWNDLLAPRGDQVSSFFLMYAGPTDRDGKPISWFPEWSAELIAGLAAYRPPPAAYILAMTRDKRPAQHRFYHGTRPQLAGSPDLADGGVEIYYSSPSFLLTAGGMFLNSGYGRDEIDIIPGVEAWAQTARAQATTLLPTRADVTFADLIRFDPYPDPTDRPDPEEPIRGKAVNTGVHLGFACGANLRIPDRWLQLAVASWDGPWLLLDLNSESLGPSHHMPDRRLGFYVAIYRTPVASPENLDPAPDNLGLLYAMEASAMSFEEFRRFTKERNSTLPDKFAYEGTYVFHSADDRRFKFWLNQQGDKYKARAMDERNPGDDFTSLPLVEGPHLMAPGGHDHDGFFEVRHPECDAPLVLDFRVPQNPLRVDNALACPKPLLDRAQALVEVANQLLALSSQLVGAGRHAEAVAPAQAAVDVLQQIEPTTEAHQSLLAEALLVLVIRLITAGRADEALGPAEEAVAAYRRAAGAIGADVGSLANQLLALSSQLVGAGRHAEAVAPAQAAVDVLQQIEPQPTTEAHQSLLAEALLVLVIRLIAAGRAAEALGPAEEAVRAYRRAAGATGADVGSLANQLLALSSQLVGAGRHAEAVAPAQAAVDVLQQIEPQPATEAHQSLLAEALLVLVIRLIAAGRADEVLGPAEEAVRAYRRAAGATGANVGSLAGRLMHLSAVLSGADRHAEAVAPAQAAVDVLRDFEPLPEAQAAYLALFAGALHALAVRLIDAQRPEDALQPAVEALEAYRRLAEDDPNAFQSQLAALEQLVAFLSQS